MKRLLQFAFAAFLSAPAFCADFVITTTKHTDAAKGGMPGMPATPAKDSTSVTWIGKEHLRIENGDDVTLLRADTKKLYMLDTKAKTYSVIDLPFDLKKYMPAEYAPMFEQMASQVKVTVTATTETKKIKEWNATKYTVVTALPMGGSMTQEIWATKDITIDAALWQETMGALQSLNPMGGAAMAAEMKKIEGVHVLTERTQSMMGNEVKTKDEVVSVEQKEPAAGLYEVPKDFTEKPFDPMAGGMGPMGGRPPKGGHGGGGMGGGKGGPPPHGGG